MKILFPLARIPKGRESAKTGGILSPRRGRPSGGAAGQAFGLVFESKT